MLLRDHNKNLFLLLAAIAVVFSLCAMPAFAQKQVKIFVVKSNNITPYNQAVEGFRKQSTTDWVITEYNLRGTLKNSNEMLDKITEAEPDLILAVGAKALAAVTQSKVPQPVLFCASINVTKENFADSNITGVSLTVSPEEQFQAMVSLAPNIKKIGVVLRRENTAVMLKNLPALAKEQNIKLVTLQLENENEIPGRLRTAVGEIDALLMLDDAYIHSKETLEFVIGTTIENDLPFLANSEAFVEAGATFALSPSFFDNGKQTALLTKKILEQNLKPKEVPIRYHENPDLIINLKIAKKISLDIPFELVDKAKRVYK